MAETKHPYGLARSVIATVRHPGNPQEQAFASGFKGRVDGYTKRHFEWAQKGRDAADAVDSACSLREINAELLEALTLLESAVRPFESKIGTAFGAGNNVSMPSMEKARAAIARAESNE